MATAFLNAGPPLQYADAVRSGQVFFAANSAAQALSVNTTAATGLILTNPLTSGYNLEIIEVCVALTVAASASNLVLTGNILTTASAATTHTTALVVKSALIGSGIASAAGALVDSSATVPTPAVIRSIGGGVLAGSGIVTSFVRDPINGLLQLAPGCVISLQAMANACTVVASIMWREVPA